jgi:hypothetical protein
MGLHTCGAWRGFDCTKQKDAPQPVVSSTVGGDGDTVMAMVVSGVCHQQLGRGSLSRTATGKAHSQGMPLTLLHSHVTLLMGYRMGQ